MGPHASATIFYGVTWPAAAYHIDTWDEGFRSLEERLGELSLSVAEYGSFVSGFHDENYMYLYFDHLGAGVNEDEAAVKLEKINYIGYDIDRDSEEESIAEALTLLKVPEDIKEKLKLGWYLAATVSL